MAGTNATPKDMKLIINWDTASMWALQLACAQRDRGVAIEKWGWMAETPGYVQRDRKPDIKATFGPDDIKALMERIVDEHAKARIDCIVHCLYVMPNGTLPSGLKAVHHYPGWRRTGYSDLSVFEQAGHDLVQTLLERSHKNGMLFLAGLRMNDRHPGSAESPFSQENPDWRLKELGAGMDYKYEGVRNTVLAFTEECLARYDVDGIELDWMRWCHMFKRAEAEENAPLLTELVAKMRGIVDDAGRRRGRGLILGMRIPQTLAECKSLGFDVRTWVRQGLADYICPSDFFHTDFNLRTEDFVALTQGTKCKVYPSVHPNISVDNNRHVHSPESYRAAATNYYAFGAYGISVYNYQYHWRSDMGSEDEWPRALSYLTELRDEKVVAPGDRRYMYHPLWPEEAPTHARKHDVVELARESKDWSAPLRLRMAENLTARHLSATLEFKVTGMAEGDAVEVQLNGQAIPGEKVTRMLAANGQSAEQGRALPPFWLYRLPLSSPPMKSGHNELCLRLTAGAGTEQPVAQEFEITVRDSRSR